MNLSEHKIKHLRVQAADQMIRDSKGLYLQIRAGELNTLVHRGAWIAGLTRRGKTGKRFIGH
jgi:hypothetical protein